MKRMNKTHMPKVVLYRAQSPKEGKDDQGKDELIECKKTSER